MKTKQLITNIVLAGLLTANVGLAAGPAESNTEPGRLNVAQDKSQTSTSVQKSKPVESVQPLPAEFNQEKAQIKGHTDHPDAQWFPDAAMGLFMHWGPASVDGREISWSMYKNYSTKGKEPDWSYRRYNDQFDRFNPNNYDPDKWMEAAARAGFKYMVITTRHCDGYPLWSSKWDPYGHPAQAGRRDYLRPLVDAARKHGLRVGLYYSPTNWNYSPEGWPHHAFPLADPEMTEHHPESSGKPRFVDMPAAEMQKYLDRFINEYVKIELQQLLTEYGKIDLLWFDGFDWPVKDLDYHGPEILAWVRQLQPGIAINDRWAPWLTTRTLGDFRTFERRPPAKHPGEAWWELCDTLCGGWSGGKGARVRISADMVLEQLARVRGWGGNYLPDVGPGPDGRMPEGYDQLCEELAAWMRHSGEAVGPVRPSPVSVTCNVPITVKDDKTWYFLATTDVYSNIEPLKNWAFQHPQKAWTPQDPPVPKTIRANGVKRPAEAILLRTGDKLEFTYADGLLTIPIPADRVTKGVDAVRVTY